MGKIVSDRGLSTVVATLIIILLTLVAIGVVWVVVRSLIFTGTQQITETQTGYDLSLKYAYDVYPCIAVQVKREVGGGNMTGIRFVFTNKTESRTFDRNESAFSMHELETKNFQATGLTGIGGGDTVAVAPIYTSPSTGKQVIGQATDSKKISPNYPQNANFCGVQEICIGCIP